MAFDYSAVINSILGPLNDFLYGYILIFLLVAAGIYFTIRTRFVQFRLVPDALRCLKEKAGETGDGTKKVSSFQALMISTASRVGTEISRAFPLRWWQVALVPYFGCG